MLNRVHAAILLVGLSGMATILATGKRLSLIDFISPAPVVFSHGRDFRKKETTLEFRLVHEDGAENTVKFGRAFYRSLEGSHHLKLLYNYFMQYENMLKQAGFDKFLNQFLCRRNRSGSKVRSIEILKADQVIKTHECP